MLTDQAKYNLASTSVLFENQLHVLAPDGVISREYLPAIQDVEALLAAARENAALIEKKAIEDALSIRRKAEADGRVWLENRERELLAKLSLQQTKWLAQLQPFWTQALARMLRQICGGLLRSDALAGAIEAGTKEFKDLSELRIEVHPADLDMALSALARFGQAKSLVRIDSVSSMEPGVCRFFNANLEVTLNIDRALDVALGKP
jgi:flagellar biosynthesis/type III secretory pathway protein FliH